MTEQKLNVQYGGGWNWLRIVTVAGSGISSVEPSGSATRQLISKMNTGELNVHYGGGWNWLRIVSNFWLSYSQC